MKTIVAGGTGLIASHTQVGSFCEPINVGTGQGLTVTDLITAYGRACKTPVAKGMFNRRPGEGANSYASTTKAERLLCWSARPHVDAMRDINWPCQSSHARPLARSG